MRRFLEQLLEQVPSDGRCEFIATFAKPYPSMVIAEVMGAPLEDAPALYRWSNLIQRQFDPTSLMTERPEIEQAVAEFYAYEDELIARRRPAPGDDLISALIEAEEAGDRLSDDELRNLILNILVGGRRHEPESARPRDPAARGAIPISGSCSGPIPAASPRRRSKRRCGSSRSRRSPRGSWSTRSSTGA